MRCGVVVYDDDDNDAELVSPEEAKLYNLEVNIWYFNG